MPRLNRRSSLSADSSIRSISTARLAVLEIVAVSYFGNPNAQRLTETVVLKGADILTQFDWFERTADAYRRYVGEITYALGEPRVPWPDKPRMPTLGEKNSPQDRPPAP